MRGWFETNFHPLTEFGNSSLKSIVKLFIFYPHARTRPISKALSVTVRMEFNCDELFQRQKKVPRFMYAFKLNEMIIY